MAAKLKKGDKVVVLTGKDKGKEGEISSVDPNAGKAVVDGVNMAIRHTKQSQSTKAAASQRRCRSSCRTWLDRRKRQSNTRWLPNGRRQESAFRQDNRGRDLMLGCSKLHPAFEARYATRSCGDERRVWLQERHDDPTFGQNRSEHGCGAMLYGHQESQIRSGRPDIDRWSKSRDNQGQEIHRGFPRS